MGRLTQRNRKLDTGGLGAGSKLSALNSKGFVAGLFIGLAALFAVSGQFIQTDVFERLILAAMTFLSFATAIMIALEKRNATRVGLISVGLFCVLLIYNLSTKGYAMFGLLWLVAVLFATKKLIELDSRSKE